MVARTLSLKGKLPLTKIWNKNSASFRNNSEEQKNNPSKAGAGGGAPPAKSKRPRACRLKKGDVEGIVFVRKCDLQVGPLLGEGGFAQVYGLFNCASLLLGDDGKESVVSLSSTKENENTPVSSASDDESSDNKPSEQALQQQQQQLYAVKTIRKGLLEDKVLFQKAADDLVNEAEILAKLDHRCIIKMRGISKDADKPTNHPQRYANFFLLLDRLSETLSDRIQYWKDFEDKKASLDIKVDYSYQLAQALEYLHQRRILFRDLKPENIGFKGTMAQNDHTVQLFDFGMARELPPHSSSSSSVSAPPLPPKRPPKAGESYQQLSTTATNTSISSSSSSYSMASTTPTSDDDEFFHLTICGTQRYMSPEVLLEGKYSLKSDCYTWSMVVWEIIAEAKPFHYMTPSVHKILVCKQGDRPPLSCYGLPEALQELLKISWAHKPTDRIPMSAICEKLKPCVRHAPDPSSPPTSITGPSPSKTHRRSNSHGVFGSFSSDITADPPAVAVAAAAAAGTTAQEEKNPPTTPLPKARISPRRTSSHGSFLNNLQNALRSPLADIPPAADQQQKNTAGNNSTAFSPPRFNKRTSSSLSAAFLSPPSATSSSRLPPIEYSSPGHNRRNARAAEDVGSPVDALKNKSYMLNSWPAPPKAHRRNNSQSSTNSSGTSLIARIPLSDLSQPDEKRSSFVKGKPKPGKVNRPSYSQNSSSLTNNIITRITRVALDNEEPPAPVTSPISDRRRSLHRNNSLTNNIITRITRIPVEETAAAVSPTAASKRNSSPDRNHRRSNSDYGSLLFPSDSNHDQSLEEAKTGVPLVSLKSSSWDAKNTPSLAELQERKKDMKEQLKQYDICFAQMHGRMPNKAEKELIRPMYDHYNALKSHIASLETLKNRLKQYDKCFARKHGRMPNKGEKEIIRPWYDEYKALKNGIAEFLLDYESSRGAEEAEKQYERVVGQKSPTFVTFHSFDSDNTPEIEVAEL